LVFAPWLGLSDSVALMTSAAAVSMLRAAALVTGYQIPPWKSERNNFL